MSGGGAKTSRRREAEVVGYAMEETSREVESGEWTLVRHC